MTVKENQSHLVPPSPDAGPGQTDSDRGSESVGGSSGTDDPISVSDIATLYRQLLESLGSGDEEA